VPVDDIVVQARESDLVLATHGRGIWIVDDISPLRALTPEVMAKDATLVARAPSIQYFDVLEAGQKATKLSTAGAVPGMRRSPTTRRAGIFSET